MQFRPIVVMSVFFSALAGALWVLTIDWTVRCTEFRAMALVRPGAVTTTMLAGLCWVTWWRVKLDHDKTLLIMTLADAVPARPMAETIPMRRVL